MPTEVHLKKIGMGFNFLLSLKIVKAGYALGRSREVVEANVSARDK